MIKNSTLIYLYGNNFAHNRETRLLSVNDVSLSRHPKVLAMLNALKKKVPEHVTKNILTYVGE